MNNFGEKVSFIWSVADLLRGPYRPNQYKDVMLPLTVLRRLDCVLEPTKEKVLAQQSKLAGGKVKNIDPMLCRVTGVPFYNTSKFSFEKLKGDPNNIAANLTHYIKGFSTRAREILDHFGFEEHIYGAFKEGEHVRIFDNADFGFRRITAERPLRLNFVVDKERCERLEATPAFVNLASSKKRKDTKAAQEEIKAGREKQLRILSALYGLCPKGMIKNRDTFEAMMRDVFQKHKIKVPTPLFKVILSVLSERDGTAELCTDAKGNPEPDAELRDNENVPLKEDVEEYMRREVLPHVPDAWVDESKTKIGYEINFNRYFYKYTPPRPLHEIESDLKQIEQEIADMLAEMTQ